MTRPRYMPTGILALEASAWGSYLDAPGPGPTAGDGVAVVSIRGPLDHRKSTWLDSYEAIRERVGAALATGPKALVLAIDSPGGDVSGCFDTATAIRSACDAAGVPLYAYVDGLAASAAYALACVASHITAPSTGLVGSIGTLTVRLDTTALDAASGIAITAIGSGARKTDCNPHSQLGDEERAALQARVDKLASVFFEHVATYRPISIDEVRALEAGVLVGTDAEARGLIDAVGTFDSLIARITSGPISNSDAPSGAEPEEVDMSEDEKARAALQAIIDDEKSDEKSKARASKALKAMDESEEDEPAKDADAESEKDADAESEDEPKKDDDDAKAGAQALAMVMEDRRERKVSALLASRSDLSAEQRTAFSALAPEQLEAVLATIPVAPKRNLAATAVVPFTRGATQGVGVAARQSPADVAKMETALGMRATKLGVIDRGDTLVLGAPIREEV